MKSWYKSKEVWVGIVYVAIVGMIVGGVDFEGVFKTAVEVYVTSAPLIMTIIRVFFTKDRITY